MRSTFRVTSILGVGLSLGSLAATSQYARADVRTQLIVHGVKVSKQNKECKLCFKEHRCNEGFAGTYGGNTVTFQAETTGGVGGYKHALTYAFDEGSYRLDGKIKPQNTKKKSKFKIWSKDGKFHVRLPELREGVHEVKQTFVLTVKDAAGDSASSNLSFWVTRQAVLVPSKDEESVNQNCTQVYQVEPSPIGRESNGGTSISRVDIKSIIQNTDTSMKGWNAGVYFNPMIGVDGILVSLFGVNYGYFSQTAYSRTEAVEINRSHDISPGDYLDVYVQKTRRVTAYDVQTVDVCGHRENYPGAYLFQTWSVDYPVRSYSPVEIREPVLSAIGTPPSNTCHEQLNYENSNSQYQYQEFSRAQFGGGQ